MKHGLGPDGGEYDSVLRAWLKRRTVDRCVDVALAAAPVPLRVLEVGCGDGARLQELLVRLPSVLELAGADPDGRTVATARAELDAGVEVVQALAEKMPFPSDSFDLVLSTIAFDQWLGRSRDVIEMVRVLAPGGHLVLIDMRAGWPLTGGRGRLSRMAEVLTAAGLSVARREIVYFPGPLPLGRAFIASR